MHATVNLRLQKFEKDMKNWMILLKDNLDNNLCPSASADLWKTFKRKFISESHTLKDLCYSHAYEKFTECLKGLQKAAYSICNEKPPLQLDIATWQPPADHMDISDDENYEPETADPNARALVLYKPLRNLPRVSRKKVLTMMVDLNTLFTKFVGPRSSGSSSKVVSIEDVDSTSVVLETLKDLKKENEAVRERLDKQDETNAEIKTWM